MCDNHCNKVIHYLVCYRKCFSERYGHIFHLIVLVELFSEYCNDSTEMVMVESSVGSHHTLGGSQYYKTAAAVVNIQG